MTRKKLGLKKKVEKPEIKKRYKMYKAKGRWLVAPLVFLSLGLANTGLVHADSVDGDANYSSDKQIENDNSQLTDEKIELGKKQVSTVQFGQDTIISSTQTVATKETATSEVSSQVTAQSQSVSSVSQETTAKVQASPSVATYVAPTVEDPTNFGGEKSTNLLATNTIQTTNTDTTVKNSSNTDATVDSSVGTPTSGNGVSLANVQVLSTVNTSVTSPDQSGNEATNPLTSTDATFVVDGKGVLDVNLLKGANKSVVIEIPEGLKDKITTNGNATGKVSFLLPVNSLTVLQPVTDLLNGVLNGTGVVVDKLIGNDDNSLLGNLLSLLTAGKLQVSVDGVDDVIKNLNLLKGSQSNVDPNSRVLDINNGNLDAPVTIKTDEQGNQYLEVNLQQEIGKIATDHVKGILDNIIKDLGNLKITATVSSADLMSNMENNSTIAGQLNGALSKIPVLGGVLSGLTGTVGNLLGGTVSTLGGLVDKLGVNKVLSILGIGDDLNPVLSANGLKVTIPSTQLNLVKTLNTLINGDKGVLSTTGNLLNEILGAAILNTATVSVPVTVDNAGLKGNTLDDTVYGGQFLGTVAESDAIDLSVLNNNKKGSRTTLYIKVQEASQYGITYPAKDVTKASDVSVTPKITNASGQEIQSLPTGAKLTVDDSNLPTGVTLGNVDQTTGTVRVNVPAGTPVGSFEIPVTVTYSDGSEDKATITMDIKDSFNYQAQAK
ncbi:adhesive domain-containing protein, partial [Ligilactobacillus equi]